MKKFAAICLLVSPLFGNFDATFDKLLPKLIHVESRGNHKAVGDSGKALGQLQIWKVVVKDVNKTYKTNYKHKDAFDRYLSTEICYLYLKHWSKVKGVSDEKSLARIWNGGPHGHKKKATLAYWNKIKTL
jgi:hypothetical protein